MLSRFCGLDSFAIDRLTLVSLVFPVDDSLLDLQMDVLTAEEESLPSSFAAAERYANF